MTWLLGVLSAVVGLAVGSFLNVVIWRLPRKESLVSPPSHCPICDRRIRPWENIPLISWLLMRRRCSGCHNQISSRYPIVELITAVIFVLVSVRIGWQLALPAFLYLSATGVALAAIDIDVKRLPNSLTLPTYVVGLAFLGVACLVSHEPGQFVRSLLGMVALFAFYFVMALAYPRGMGFGDVKLSGVLGLFLAYLGWKELAVGAFLAFLVGGLAGIALILFAGGSRKTKIPFGPYMLGGALLGILFGAPLANTYLSLTLS